MPKPLIVCFTDSYPSSEYPRNGITYRDHAQALSHAADVAVICCHTPTVWHSGSRKPKQIVSYDHSVFVWRGTWPVWSHKFGNFAAEAEKQALLHGFHRVEREFGRAPDFVLAHNVMPAGKWAAIIKSEYGHAFATIEHLSHLERLLKNQYDEIIQIYNQATFIAGVSNSIKDLLIGYLPEPIHERTGVIGNVLGNEFQSHKPSPPPESGPFRWLFVGDDYFLKGPELLHQVFSNLNRNDWQLTIIGSGQFAPFRDDLSLQGKVEFHRDLGRLQLIDIMQRHHALISTSHVDAFGKPILEMMAAGRPVVATRSGGPQDYVTDECGIITNVGRRDELIKAVTRIQEEYHKYDSGQIRDYTLQRYGQRVYADRILNLIDVFS